jgi:hypothetical protein
MKNTIIITMAISSMFILNSCSSNSNVAPSQNSALNSVSNSNGKAKSGYMQKAMEGWFESEWTPTVSKDKEIQEKYMKKVENSAVSEEMATQEKDITKTEITDTKVEYIEDKDRDFTLQEYVDKAAVYTKSHPADYESSNVKKLESMPVIGK